MISVEAPLAQHSDQRDQDDQQWERDPDVDQSLEELVEPASPVARDHCDQGRQRFREDHGGEADAERDPSPVDHAAQQVAPKIVCTEEV